MLRCIVASSHDETFAPTVMARNAKVKLGGRVLHMRQTNARARSPAHDHAVPRNSRARGGPVNPRLPFVPPEIWHEPVEDESSYRVIVDEPGPGYRHVVTRDELIQRLADLPEEFLRPLDVLRLSRMTRKKQSFPCYGMQWGSSIYLYPMEESLTEQFSWAPKPSQLIEAQMYGGRWVDEGPRGWRLHWTERTIKDFYLNNILIHELGHLLDERNRGYTDRERFAEWFAVRYGYQSPRRQGAGRRRVVRRHHAK